ncbi:unnamed protein product [Dovyalis caffra]|uniref:Uncharacterized protein n=1 Tax=Dovyalis caffra TaxID=77055 RepID=A0AAV1RSY0_9ROSI|nr:unnamed protein product [Dovyalis caffra]
MAVLVDMVVEMAEIVKHQINSRLAFDIGLQCSIAQCQQVKQSRPFLIKVRLFAALGGKFLDDNQECKNADGKRKIDIFEGEGTSDVAANNNRGSTVESLDDIEEGTYWNRLPVSEDSNSCTQGALTTSERANGSGSAAENLNVKVKGVDQFESVARLPIPTECHLISLPFLYFDVFIFTLWMITVEKFSSAAADDDSCRFPAEEFQPVLCKAGFSVITKVEDAATSDLKNYSQTLLRASSAVDVFVNMFQEQNKFGSGRRGSELEFT